MEAFPPVVSMQVLDPEALTAAIRNANFQSCQLSDRPSPSWMARVMCETVCLDYAKLGPAMLFSGAMPVDCYTLVFVTECPQKGRSFNFATEHTDGYMGFFPPGGMLDAYTPEGYANATLTVPSAVFLAAVERFFPEIPERILSRGGGMRIGAAEQVRLRGLLRACTEVIEDPSGVLLGAAARRHLEFDLLDAFLIALRSGSESLVPVPGSRIEGRLKRLKQARDYLTEHLHQTIDLEDLCGELAMSRRGVEVLFRDALGIGPITFLRHQRLHGVRRALLSAPSKQGEIKKAALDWGFWHLGHFAREYRELFGESPSSTLLLRSRE